MPCRARCCVCLAAITVCNAGYGNYTGLAIKVFRHTWSGRKTLSSDYVIAIDEEEKGIRKACWHNEWHDEEEGSGVTGLFY